MPEIVIRGAISCNVITTQGTITETNYTISGSICAKIEYAKIPSNYGLITYNGEYILVS